MILEMALKYKKGNFVLEAKAQNGRPRVKCLKEDAILTKH